MTILIVGFSSFPSSISNSSNEILDQTNSPSLINMAFAVSDKEDKAAAKATEKADKAAAKATEKADKAAAKATEKADKAAAKATEKAEAKIQEFDNGVVVQTSSTTTICHIPPGNPSNAHTITIGVSAVKAHLGHGDLSGSCAENSLEDILSKNTKKPKTCFLFWCW